MVVNGALLAGITLWVVAVAFNGPIPAPAAAPRATPSASASPTAPTIPDRAEFIKPDAPYFGLTSPQSPWSRLELNNLANKAGAHPTLIQFFVKWTEDFRPDAVAMCYKQNAVPVLSWEPWS